MIRRPPISTRTEPLLSLHDALPILGVGQKGHQVAGQSRAQHQLAAGDGVATPGCLPKAHGQAHQQGGDRSEEHTSELQSLMRISYAVFCLKKKKKRKTSSTNIKDKDKLNTHKTHDKKYNKSQ